MWKGYISFKFFCFLIVRITQFWVYTRSYLYWNLEPYVLKHIAFYLAIANSLVWH